MLLCLGCGGDEMGWCEYGSCNNYFFVVVVGCLIIDGIEVLCLVIWSFFLFSLENVVWILFGEGKVIDNLY